MDASKFPASRNVEDRRASEALPNLLIESEIARMRDNREVPPAWVENVLAARRPYDPNNPFSSGAYQGLPNEPISFGQGRPAPSPQGLSVADQMRARGLYEALSNIIKNGMPSS